MNFASGFDLDDNAVDVSNSLWRNEMIEDFFVFGKIAGDDVRDGLAHYLEPILDRSALGLFV